MFALLPVISAFWRTMELMRPTLTSSVPNDSRFLILPDVTNFVGYPLCLQISAGNLNPFNDLAAACAAKLLKTDNFHAGIGGYPQ